MGGTVKAWRRVASVVTVVREETSLELADGYVSRAFAVHSVRHSLVFGGNLASESLYTTIIC
jgi:hypothetical protein